MEAADRYRLARRAEARAEFGEATEKDFQLVSTKFWQTVRRLRKGRWGSVQLVLSQQDQLLTS